MSANPHIFREYDIRGNAKDDLPVEVVESIGRGLGTIFRERNKRRIAVGRDCRLSSPAIHAALTKGLIDAGIELIDIGVGPTPLLYFSVFHKELDGGVHVTGSHNPPEDNGIKMMIGQKSFFGDDIRMLRDMVLQNQGTRAQGGGRTDWDPTDAYVANVCQDIQLERTDLRFAVDAGNGAGGPLALRTFKALGLDPVPLLCEMDGAFPVHHPDPTDPATLQLLQQTVDSQQLDFGVAFDGDADRIGVIDDRGDVVWGDKLMVLFSRAVLKVHPGAAILGEVKCSQTLFDDIAARGGRPVVCKTGHSLIKTKMAEESALLAGEMSGHLFFADRYYGYDDAIYAAARLIELLARSNTTMGDQLSDLPTTYTTPEIRTPCADDLKFRVVDAVLAHFRKTHRVVDIDGARVLFDRGWGLVRASNTQPVLVQRFEATSEDDLKRIRVSVEEVVEASLAAL